VRSKSDKNKKLKRNLKKKELIWSMFKSYKTRRDKPLKRTEKENKKLT